MKMFLLFCFSVLSFGALGAETVKIEYIEFPKNKQQETHLYLSDGRIGRLAKGSDLLSISQEALDKNLEIEIALDAQHRVNSIKPFSSTLIENPEEMTSISPEGYSPTILPDMSSVTSIFRKMNRRWQKESQCYNRAHVWNYEEFKRSGLRSKKVFIFFTSRYIRNYNFYWWFHAIPTVLVRSDGIVVERALDPKFARGPLPMKPWSDIFVRSKRNCPVVTKYSDYRNNQSTEDCYLHFSSMFYWQPRDLSNFERTGYEKKNFIQSEVNHAYWEAF